MTTRVECTIVNERGLHARSAARFVNTVADFHCSVTVSCNGKRADGASLIEMMMLAAGRGQTLIIEADGPQASEAAEALAHLVRSGFDE
jgi:phosphocarrier protein